MSSEVNQKYIKKFYVSQNFETREDPINGFLINGYCVSKELLLDIFTYLKPKELLKCSEVCDNWNKIIKTSIVWKMKYAQKFDKTPKNWPWFVLYAMITTNYFDQNLLLNGSGEDGVRHWTNSYYCGNDYRACLGSSGFLTLGSLNTASGIEDQHELLKTQSCFQAVKVPCSKYQFIDLTKNTLFHAIINAYKPTIYVSEWRSSTFPLSSTTYTLEVYLYKKGKVVSEKHQHQHDIFRYQDAAWKKVI